MKNLAFFFAAFLLCSINANAQFFSVGLKGGVNSQVNKPSDIFVPGDTAFNFGVKDFKFGTQFGAYVRIGNRVFFQPEILLNSNKTDYKIQDGNLGEIVKSERYQYLDMPLLLGFSAGPFRFSGGPVGHYFLNSSSELTDIHGYSARFKEMAWGYQAGLTIGKGRISADIRYEGNFNNTGDHITFFGTPYHFANTPSRVVVGLNIALIK